MKTITICGGGSLGHVIAGWLSSKNKAEVNILTNHPEKWTHSLDILAPENITLKGRIAEVSANPADLIPESDIVLLCLPGFMIREEILKIKPFLRSDTFVGSVFSSTGFFFETLNLLPETQPLWGFQRVPFIARVAEYGRSAYLKSYKPNLNIAVEHSEHKDEFRQLMQEWFEIPVNLLNNYYEASLTNSNPLLHTSRLYTMFSRNQVYPRMIMFYEEWTEEAAGLLIRMDREFFALLSELPVAPDFLPTILDYYESTDARSLAAKLSSIQGFRGITSPMRQTPEGWVADFDSRYFTEDFPFGLRYIYDLTHKHNIPSPAIDLVYEWGIKARHS